MDSVWTSAHRLPRRTALAGLAAGGLALAGCGGGAPKPAGSSATATASVVRGGTLTVALQSDIASLDPLKSSAVYDRQIQYHVYDSLIATNKELQLVPGLALSWETSDPLSIVFKLRPGVKFHDGTDFNADAVKFNFDRILQTASSPRLSEIAGVTAVQAVDSSTVKLVLKAPSSPLLAQLVDRSGMILSPAAVQKAGDGLALNPAGAGSGAFTFVEYRKDDHLTLQRNESYWGKDASGAALPYLDRLVYRPLPDETQRLNSLRTGEVDFVDAPPRKDVASIKQDGSLSYDQVPSLAYSGFWMNGAEEPFRDMRVRQALAWSIDRQQIIDTVYFKLPVVSNGPVAPPQFAYDPTYKAYSYDVGKAKPLLSAAGRSGVTFTLLVMAGSPQAQQQAELIQEQAKAAGFTVNIQQLDFPTILSNLMKHQFQAAAVGWSGRIDPDGNTYIQYHTGGGNNYGQYSNPTVDKALEDARASFDQSQRKSLYQQVNKSVADDAAEIFIYHDITSQCSTAKVRHYTVVADGIYRVHDVWKQA